MKTSFTKALCYVLSIAILVCCLLIISGNAVVETVSTDRSVYTVGEQINISYGNLQDYSSAWPAIYYTYESALSAPESQTITFGEATAYNTNPLVTTGTITVDANEVPIEEPTQVPNAEGLAYVDSIYVDTAGFGSSNDGYTDLGDITDSLTDADTGIHFHGWYVSLGEVIAFGTRVAGSDITWSTDSVQTAEQAIYAQAEYLGYNYAYRFNIEATPLYDGTDVINEIWVKTTLGEYLLWTTVYDCLRGYESAPTESYETTSVPTESLEPTHTPAPTEYVNIYTKEQLDAVRNNLSGNYMLMEDIVFTEADFAEGGAFYNEGVGWLPIGSDSAPFTGVFDGNGHTINGLKIDIRSDSTTCGYVGLFRYVSKGTISNLGMIDSDIDVTSPAYCVGSIVGYANNSTISNCYNTGNIVATMTELSATYIGGVIGCTYRGTISNCYNTGNLVGVSTVETGSPTDHDGIWVGGIAGCSAFFDEFISCYNSGSVIAKTSLRMACAGGVVGCGGTIRKCYNIGRVEAEATSCMFPTYAGGLAGMDGSLSDCYNVGSVFVKASANAYAGGISTNGGMSRCYNIGRVEAETTSSYYSVYVGGTSSTGSLYNRNCYYIDYVNYNADADTPCTVEEMQKRATFVGFDFDTVWTMGGNTDYAYPELRSVEMEFESDIVSIEMSTPPAKVEYIKGVESLVVTGGEVVVKYSNLPEVALPLTADMITDLDSTITGIQTLTVSYNGKTTTFEAEIVYKTLLAIAVTTMPTKVEYLANKDTLDVTGGKLMLCYDNGEIEEIALDTSMVTGFDNTIVGTQALTVAYGGKTTKYDVDVVVKRLIAIAVAAKPTKLEYLANKDALDVTGGTLTLCYNNGTSEEIAIEEDMISGFDNATVGTQSLTVTYGGKTTTYDVEIIEIGVTVSGSVVSFGADGDTVIEFWINDELAYSATASGTTSDNKFTGNYSISKVTAGTYTVKVMKTNHVTREYTLTVSDGDTVLDVEIWLKGDVTGDGKITIMDVGKINSHVRNVVLLTGYVLQCADVVGTDGKVTIMDVGRVNAHARDTNLLW